MATKTDTQVNLVINRMTRQVYDELSATPGSLKKNELYLIEDEVYDVFNKRVVNVQIPQDENDAVNLNYLSSNYLQEGQMMGIIDEIGSSKLFNVLSTSYPIGSQYINGNGDIYKKDTSKWDIRIISSTGAVSNVTLQWTSASEFGWRIHYTLGGTNYTIVTYNTNELADVVQGTDSRVNIKAISWTKQDRLVKVSEIKTALNSISTSSSTADIAQALINLKNLAI